MPGGWGKGDRCALLRFKGKTVFQGSCGLRRMPSLFEEMPLHNSGPYRAVCPLRGKQETGENQTYDDGFHCL